MTGVAGEARTVLYEREFARHSVKVLPGEFFVSDEDIVITTVLGSCVAACICDRQARVGGMNHFMLPESSGQSDPTGLAGRYGAFAMELLINEVLKRGARKAALEAKVFGGGQVLRGMTMNIGERNAASSSSSCAPRGSASSRATCSTSTPGALPSSRRAASRFAESWPAPTHRC
jgi:CheD, stimulates methylation of MCP proteins